MTFDELKKGMTPVFKNRHSSGYEGYAVTYWNDVTGEIMVVEEDAEGKVLGAFYPKKRPVFAVRALSYLRDLFNDFDRTPDIESIRQFYDHYKDVFKPRRLE